MRVGPVCTSATRTPDDLADRLIGLLGDPERRDALRAAGRLRAAQFDWASVAKQVL